MTKVLSFRHHKPRPQFFSGLGQSTEVQGRNPLPEEQGRGQGDDLSLPFHDTSVTVSMCIVTLNPFPIRPYLTLSFNFCRHSKEYQDTQSLSLPVLSVPDRRGVPRPPQLGGSYWRNRHRGVVPTEGPFPKDSTESTHRMDPGTNFDSHPRTPEEMYRER